MRVPFRVLQGSLQAQGLGFRDLSFFLVQGVRNLGGVGVYGLGLRV